MNDLDFLYYLYNDPEILENSVNHGREPIKKSEIVKTINYFSENKLDFLIVYNDVYKIGLVNIYEKNYEGNYALLGLVLSEDFRNRGIGMVVMDAVEEYIRSNYYIRLMCGQVYSTNPRSIAFIEKFGYKKDYAKTDQIDINGKIVNRYFFYKTIQYERR